MEPRFRMLLFQLEVLHGCVLLYPDSHDSSASFPSSSKRLLQVFQHRHTHSNSVVRQVKDDLENTCSEKKTEIILIVGLDPAWGDSTESVCWKLECAEIPDTVRNSWGQNKAAASSRNSAAAREEHECSVNL